MLSLDNYWNANELYSLNDNNYKVTGKYVTVLYCEKFIKPLFIGDALKWELSPHNFIHFIKAYGYSLLNIDYTFNCAVQCHLCNKYDRGYRFNVNFNISAICNKCDKYYKSKPISPIYYVSKKEDFSKPLAFILTSQNEFKFIYYHQYKLSHFNYSTIVNLDWFRQNRYSQCTWCHKNKSYKNSTCLQCYQYIYFQFFQNIKKFLVFSKIQFCKDIMYTILIYYLSLLDINITYNNLYHYKILN